MNIPLPPPEIKTSTAASIRTATPVAWGTASVILASKLGLPLDATEAVILSGAAGVIFHRLGMLIQLRWPNVGAVLLGTAAQPVGYAKIER